MESAGGSLAVHSHYILFDSPIHEDSRVASVGELTLDFNGIINLNETGAFLFGLLQKGAEREELIEKLLDEYNVSPEKAAADIDIFLEKVRAANVLE